MLLPSALPCDIASVTKPERRPKLPSFAPYEPRATTQSTRISALGMFASCRSLQAVLGNALPLAPITQTLLNPFDNLSHTESSGQRVPKPMPPRGFNKRRRDKFEDDHSDFEKENKAAPGSGIVTADAQYSTPKRIRRIPLSMPLGLSAQDFDDLNLPMESIEVSLPDTEDSSNQENMRDDDSGYGPSPTDSDVPWTSEDDRMLVETVLEKLKLSKGDWNDCARILGKDKDSLGRRWKLLVGEGNVGLRRRGRMRRTDLDIRSWC